VRAEVFSIQYSVFSVQSIGVKNNSVLLSFAQFCCGTARSGHSYVANSWFLIRCELFTLMCWLPWRGSLTLPAGMAY
jgi:hypothetical protein